MLLLFNLLTFSLFSCKDFVTVSLGLNLCLQDWFVDFFYMLSKNQIHLGKSMKTDIEYTIIIEKCWKCSFFHRVILN